jgi:SAM-dependent methyltransferase
MNEQVTSHEHHRGRADLFAAGDYSFWSRMFEPSSEALIRSAGVAAGDLVLDVAAGNGNTAIAAARGGALVVALDLSPTQIERGRRRTRAEGRSITWVEGDAERLPFADEAFRGAFNSFGDVIAVDEMFRVVRPGGVVGIMEWTGDGFLGALETLYERLELGDGDTPETETPEVRPKWGQEDHVRERMGPHADHLDFQRRAVHARFESAADFTDELEQKDPYGPRFSKELTANIGHRLSDDLRHLVAEWNRADDGTVLLELDYLLTVSTKPVAFRPPS